jgi:hypothetical protein
MSVCPISGYAALIVTMSTVNGQWSIFDIHLKKFWNCRDWM